MEIVRENKRRGDSQIQPIYKKRKNITFIYTLLIILGVVLFLIYAYFFNPNFSDKITGKIATNTEPEENVFIEGSLGVPEVLQSNSLFEKLSLKTENAVSLNIEDQRIELKKGASIIFDEFEGEIFLSKQNTSRIQGKAKKIFVDGIPISQISGSNIGASLEYFYFSYIKMEGFELNNFRYKTSGNLRVDEDKIKMNLNSDDFFLRDFFGDVEINKNTLKLKGYVGKSDLSSLIYPASK